MLGMIMKKINLDAWKMFFFSFVLFFLHQISKYMNILSKCNHLLMDLYLYVASLVAQIVKNLPVIQETQVLSLGQEDPLEKQNANLLQYSFLQNSMDEETWRATVHGIARSWSDWMTSTFTFRLNWLGPFHILITWLALTACRKSASTQQNY